MTTSSRLDVPFTSTGARLLLDGRRIPMDETLLSIFKHQVAQSGDGPAVHFLGREFSWREFDDASDAFAAALQDGGIRARDRVAIQLQNSPQFLIALLGIWKAGGAAALIGPMYRVAETKQLLQISGAVTLITQIENWQRDGHEAIRDTGVVRVITSDLRDWAGVVPPHLDATARLDNPSDTDDFTNLVEQFAGRAPESMPCSPADHAIVAFTSGTTGPAKGTHTVHSNLLHGSAAWTNCYGVDHDSHVMLSLAPYVHITGVIGNIGAWIWSGCSMVILPRFNPAHALQLVEELRVTWTVGAATVYTALLQTRETRDFDTSSLDILISGGAPIPATLEARLADAFGADLRPGFGMTETTTAATVTYAGQPVRVDSESGIVSVGQPTTGVSIRIKGDGGEILGPQESGEVLVHGPNVIDGYWENPEESAKTFEDGWLHTGDVGFLDEDGWLYLVDRTKNMIIASGYKVWPREVEEVIYRFSNVKEVAVIGVPDAYRGETVKAFVSLRDPNTEIDHGALIAHCREVLAAYKVPRLVEVIAELPKNANGKIQHLELRKRHEAAS